MNSMSLRQKAVAAALVVIALYVGAALFWFLAAESNWKKAARRYAQAKKTYLKEEKLISEKAKWDEAYEAEKAAMPIFASGKATDTTWLSLVGSLATTNLVQISQRSASKETPETDDVTVLPIDATWDASLEALVKFLHALENSEEGLFAVTKLNFRPSQKPGYLRGTFTLNCAYMREESKVEKGKGGKVEQ